MNPATRRTLIGLGIAGVVGGPLLVALYMSLGLWFAPPWPVPATSPVLPLIGEALWVRANAGAATDLRPIGPVSILQFAACMALAETESDAALQDVRQAGCRKYLPALDAVEYLTGVHLRAAGMAKPGFREGHARFVTTVWTTRSWTKADLLNTLAERGEFGMGLRGLEQAAQGYFGVPAAQLTVPQVAMVAALIGGVGPDPWCDPEAASILRHRILMGMRDNGAIDEQTYEAADRSELGLASPAANHPSCEG